MEEVKRKRGRPRIDAHITELYSRGRRQALLLNQRLDVEMDGVTYHLTSVFDGEKELGEVIDTIELERNLRQTA